MFALSVSFPVEGAGHCPSLFQEVPEASWIGYKQTPVVNSQESDPEELQRFAGSVRSKTSGRKPLPVVTGCSVNVGPRRFHHEKLVAQEAQCLPVMDVGTKGLHFILLHE